MKGKWEVPKELWEQDQEAAENLSYALERAKRAATLLEGQANPEADYIDILGFEWGRLLQAPTAAVVLAGALERTYAEQAYAVLMSLDLEAGGWLEEAERLDLWDLLRRGTPPLEAWAEALGFRNLPNLWTAARAEEVGTKDPEKLRDAARWWLCAAQIRAEFGSAALADASEYGACELLERLKEGGGE